MAELNEAIGKTIKYGRRFGVNYTKTDIIERLISSKRFKNSEIDKALEEFEIFKLKFENVRNRLLRRKNKIKKAEKLAELIGKKFNDILFIGVTGSVAAGYPKKADDIDLMIICKKDSLWITRLKLRWYIYKNKIPHRQWRAVERPDEFCFNLWLEEDSLTLPKDKQILQNAMDLILMKPILNKDKIYEKFLIENKWAGKYVATGYSNKISNFKYQISKEKRKINSNTFKAVLNYLAFWGQYWYMKNKMTTEVVNFRQAFFHPKLIFKKE